MLWKLKILKLKTSTSVSLSLVNWEKVFPTGYPPILFKHALMLMPGQFGSVMVPCRWADGIKSPLSWQQGSLYDWVEVFHIKVDDDGSLRTWHRGAHTHFIPPVVLLPWLRPVSNHCGHSVCYPMASMGWNIYPSTKCMWSCRYPLPLHVTWSLHPSSVEAAADIHWRSCSFLLIHPREVFLSWH